MSIRAFFRNQDGDFEELIDRIDDRDFEVTMSAEEGSVSISEVPIQDPDADLYVGGLRTIYFMETEVVDADNRVIGLFSLKDRRIKRTGGEHTNLRTQASRVWNAQIEDINALLHRRIQRGADTKRPAETDIERLTWLLSTSEAGVFTNETLIDETEPVDMDENDYATQRNYDILADISQASGKNFYAKRFNDGTFGIVYQHGDGDYDTSDIRLSNDMDDVNGDEDGDTYYALYDNLELLRSPERVYSGVSVPYDGGYQYVRRGQTVIDFTERDTNMPSPNVKTSSQARTRALRYTREISREEDIITASFLIENARVNDLREGQRMEVRFTHLPGYEGDFVWMRAMNRTVAKESPELYRITVELSAEASQGFTAPGDVYGILTNCLNKGGFEVWWAHEGQNDLATVGPIHTFFYPDQYEPSHSYREWVMDGDGTVDVQIIVSSLGIQASETATLTFNLMKNEDIVASDTIERTIENWPDSNFGPFGGVQTFGIQGLSVATDDVLQVRFVIVGTLINWIMPAGTGQNGEKFEIVEGELS